MSSVRALLEAVADPEIPVLTISDLGVLRDVTEDNGQVVVTITPTYSGCPAMHVIEEDIRRVLAGHGFRDVEIRTQLSPAWTTEWISEEGRRKLREYGIAPPEGDGSPGLAREKQVVFKVRCPHCGALDTEKVSEYGSTACKALYRCRACLEPFDYFKPL